MSRQQIPTLALAPSLSVAASSLHGAGGRPGRTRRVAGAGCGQAAADPSGRSFAAGGTTDVLARLLAEELRAVLGQPVLVENKGGAGGNIGAAEVARAAGDGATLMMATPGPLAVNQYLYPKPGYNAEKDFAAINNVAFVANVLMASAQSGIRALRELIARAQAEPGRITYGSAGVGSTSHLAGELLKAAAGIDLTHVPYKGVAPAMNDLLGGQIDLMFDNLPTALAHIQSGKVTALGVSSPTPATALPDVPAIASRLPGYEIESWFGIVGPASLPPKEVARLEGAIGQALQRPALRQRIEALGRAWTARAARPMRPSSRPSSASSSSSSPAPTSGWSEHDATQAAGGGAVLVRGQRLLPAAGRPRGFRAPRMAARPGGPGRRARQGHRAGGRRGFPAQPRGLGGPRLALRLGPAGRPRAAAVFQAYVDEVLDDLRGQHWDAIYLSLHGACITDADDSPELSLLRAIRAEHPRVPIGASFDLHANIPPALPPLLSCSASYRTYPTSTCARRPRAAWSS